MILFYVIDAWNMLQLSQRREALCGIFMRWAYLCRMQSGDASRNGVAAQLCRVVPDRQDCFTQIYSVVLVLCGFGMLE